MTKLSDKLTSRLNQKYGPWALISGGSSGIGLELATRLAEAGLNIVLHGRNQKRLEEIKRDLMREFNRDISTISTDIADSKGVNKLLEETKNLDIGLLVASAGYGTSGSFLHTSLHEEVNMLRVNNEALLMLTHHFARRLAGRGGGGMILMSSMVGFQGVPYAANYAASKAYVQSLAEALSEELKPQQIDVLAAAPGPVRSGFGRRANMQMSMALKPEDVGIPILKALGKKSVVLPGILTKALVYALRTVPRWGKVKIMKQVMGGMTRHQMS